MINEVAKDIIQIFECKTFVETGIYLADTLKLVSSWFTEFDSNFEKGISNYKIFEVDLDHFRTENAHTLFGNNQNIIIQNESSEVFLENLIEQKIIDYNKINFFYLDAHWNKYWPLRDEIKKILRIERQIIAIDDFKTLGKDFGYDTYSAGDCSYELIADLIKDRTNVIYYAAIPNSNDRGFWIIFLDFYEDELNKKLESIQDKLIKQKIN